MKNRRNKKKSINVKTILKFLVNLYSFDTIFIQDRKSIYKNEIIIEINRHLDSS